MDEALGDHLLALGFELTSNELADCAAWCERRRVDAESFAERWVAFSLTRGGGVRPDAKSLACLEREDEAEAQDSPVLNTNGLNSSNIIADYLPEDKLVSPAAEDAILHDAPLSFPPDTDPCTVNRSIKYNTRINSGDVVCSFGNDVELSKCIWNNTWGEKCIVSIIDNGADPPFGPETLYGFELLQNKASLLDENIKYVSECILKKSNITEVMPVKCKSQVPITITGRLDCDSDGKLNSKSVVLQGAWEDSLGYKVSVDLDQLNQYSLFPGQIVAMTGLNINGNKFVAHELHYEASFAHPSLPTFDHGPLHIVVASGPFTTSNNLAYDPLTDLIKYITLQKPHAVILIGPFLDNRHICVVDNLMSETFKNFFEKLVDTMMNTIESTSQHTQVIFVSSAEDAFHLNVYPTPPYHIRKKYTNLVVAPDPCVIDINGIKIGVTATDVLMHLSREEISLPLQGPDKMGRLASHLLSQQNFYPLYPPNSSVSLDTGLWSKYAYMSVVPNILVLPSDFRYFVKEINGCIVVNPEHLTKGVGGGTFTRMQIQSTNFSSGNILCQVLRI